MPKCKGAAGVQAIYFEIDSCWLRFKRLLAHCTSPSWPKCSSSSHANLPHLISALPITSHLSSSAQLRSILH
ncbi:hypothetical protein EGR_07217 [Echinococcus granulosus]|uniref:Uncharacterized protein n=1 Tax=Echinococcus granulosus TaxID=6210 RepID=W6UIL9_ECHGR|nr:hypothetical protein EGR_07217 [Echinococcus granulosus]EUB57947.1 hypothetical protein EGR_07217 [Echinococcus granulosus]